jgi:hypothetical protein
MPSVIRPVEAIEVDYICDECGTGRMRHTGASLMSSPPKFVHRCNQCGSPKSFDGILPYRSYRIKEQPNVKPKLTTIGRWIFYVMYGRKP